MQLESGINPVHWSNDMNLPYVLDPDIMVRREVEVWGTFLDKTFSSLFDYVSRGGVDANLVANLTEIVVSSPANKLLIVDSVKAMLAATNDELIKGHILDNYLDALISLGDGDSAALTLKEYYWDFRPQVSYTKAHNLFKTFMQRDEPKYAYKFAADISDLTEGWKGNEQWDIKYMQAIEKCADLVLQAYQKVYCELEEPDVANLNPGKVNQANLFDEMAQIVAIYADLGAYSQNSVPERARDIARKYIWIFSQSGSVPSSKEISKILEVDEMVARQYLIDLDLL